MPGALLLFVMFTRFGPLARAETEPANSSVAPLETTAVTPVPIVGVPLTTLNRSVPVVTESVLPLLSVGAASISTAPRRP